MNAHSPLWNHTEPNKRGKLLEELMDENNFVLINPGLPTYQKRAGGMNTLDLSIVSKRLSSKCQWDAHVETLGSDHIPSFVHINQELFNVEYKPNQRWNFNNAEWATFREICNEAFSMDLRSQDIDKYYDNIRSAIITSAEDSKPITKTKRNINKSLPYWNDSCTKAVTLRNRARCRMNKTGIIDDCIEYRRLKAIAQRELLVASREHWQNYCNTLDSNTKLGSVWKMNRKMNGIVTKTNIPTLTCNGQSSNTNTEKANMLADSFELNSSDDNYRPAFLQHKLVCESVTNFSMDTSSTFEKENDLNQTFAIHELKTAIHEMKSKSSPGPDKITYEMLKKISDIGLETILHLYNTIGMNGILPKAWKHAIILPIAKPGKDSCVPSNSGPAPG